jgi:uncharacterized protein YlbG (UPF0298 family)
MQGKKSLSLLYDYIHDRLKQLKKSGDISYDPNTSKYFIVIYHKPKADRDLEAESFEFAVS